LDADFLSDRAGIARGHEKEKRRTRLMFISTKKRGEEHFEYDVVLLGITFGEMVHGIIR